ncbi:MAG: macro domain-containing protein [Planctomycetes bacterium]|nr:macro domain-containing protein [Planctomycetota bacterium]
MSSLQIGARSIECIQGNIVDERVDAIVNAANRKLQGGGGVDGAIHAAAGPGLVEECRKLGGCATGDAKITKGHKLAAKWIIHAVGPVYSDGKSGEAELLRRTYLRCLQIAKDRGIITIAFPAISTGIYRYPLREAAKIAFDTIAAHLEAETTITTVRYILWTRDAFDEHAEILQMIRRAP